MRKLLATLIIVLSTISAYGQRIGVASPDPLVMNFTGPNANLMFRNTTGLTPQQFTVNPAKKTLLLFVAGQSNWTNVTPTLYTPTNSTAVLMLNVNDGAIYPITGQVLGSTDEVTCNCGPSGAGIGNISARVADTLVTNGKFDFVIIENFAVGGTSAANWSTSGPFYDWGTVAIARAAALGITCSTTGVTCGFIWGQGEQEVSLGTSQAAYAASLSAWITHMKAGGFSGRFFVCEETWASGSTYANVQNAQIAIVDGVTIFSGGNLDSLNATNRLADNTHFNNTGAAAAAALMITAMGASGAPY